MFQQEFELLCTFAQILHQVHKYLRKTFHWTLHYPLSVWSLQHYLVLLDLWLYSDEVLFGQAICHFVSSSEQLIFCIIMNPPKGLLKRPNSMNGSYRCTCRLSLVKNGYEAQVKISAKNILFIEFETHIFLKMALKTYVSNAVLSGFRNMQMLKSFQRHLLSMVSLIPPMHCNNPSKTGNALWLTIVIAGSTLR